MLTCGPGQGHDCVSMLQLVKGVETPCRPRRTKKADGKEARARQERWVAKTTQLLYLFVVLNQLMIFADSDWDCGEETFQDGEDRICNTLLITGPTGVGKTAAVYACAQELGFKVQSPNSQLRCQSHLNALTGPPASPGV